jgi:hypothetical protein
MSFDKKETSILQSIKMGTAIIIFVRFIKRNDILSWENYVTIRLCFLAFHIERLHYLIL